MRERQRSTLMPGEDKFFSRADILNGMDDDYLYNSPGRTLGELLNTKTKPKVKPKPRSNIPGPRARNNEFNIVVPGQKLKTLKDTIRKQQTKPTLEQHQQYYELSEEIERRGDAYFKQLDELNKSKGNNNHETTKRKT